MPNWCHTNYAVWGELHELKKLKSRLEAAQKYIKTESDFGQYWLGNILVSMRLLPLKDVRKGIIPGNLHCRGSIENSEFVIDRLPDKSGGRYYFTFETETAWGPMTGLWEAVLGKFKTLKHVYAAEECGCELFINTDEEGMFFRDRYVVRYCLGDENAHILRNREALGDCTMYLSEDEADDWVCATFNGVNTVEELMSFADTFNPKNDDFLSVNKFEKA